MMKNLLMSTLCLFMGSALATTTVVYNVSNNTCSGTNMNCEGLNSGSGGAINAVGENVIWDTKGATVTDLGTINEQKEVTLNFISQGAKTVYTLTPGQGAKKRKRIRVLFVKFPTNETLFKGIPTAVKDEVIDIRKKQNNIQNIIKVYRQFSTRSSTAASEWVDVATLVVPQDAVDPQKINIAPDGTATVTSTDKTGESLDVVIALQNEY